MEVRHKSCQIQTIVVDRFVDGELHFSKDIIVRDLKKTEVIEFAGEVVTEYVRHPTYNGIKMPNATQVEIKKYELEMQNKTNHAEK